MPSYRSSPSGPAYRISPYEVTRRPPSWPVSWDRRESPSGPDIRPSGGDELALASLAWLSSDEVLTDNSELLASTDPRDWKLNNMQDPVRVTHEGRECWELKPVAGDINHDFVATYTGPKNGQMVEFTALFHAGDEDSLYLGTLESGVVNSALVQLNDDRIADGGSGAQWIDGEILALDDGWFRVTWRYRYNALTGSYIRIYIRNRTGWDAAGTETMYMVEPSVRMLTAVEAEAPSGSKWEQASKDAQPIVSPGAGSVLGVGGAFASSVYLETSANIPATNISLAWVGHPSMLTHQWGEHSDDDMVVFRGINDGGDTLEVLLINDGTRDRWAVRSTISAVLETLTLPRGASWATACVGVSIAEGVLTWYVDGEEVEGGSFTVPTGIHTLRCGQMGGGSGGWQAVITDLAVWGVALTALGHTEVASYFLDRAGIAWGPWDIVIVGGQSNSLTGGRRSDALEVRAPLPAIWNPFCSRELAQNFPEKEGNEWTARSPISITSSEDDPIDVALTENAGSGVAYGLLSEAVPAKRLVIQVASSGCPLAPADYSWDPDSANAYTLQVEYFLEQVERITGAVGSRVMVWVHGESDCTEARAHLYQARLEHFLDRWESDCGALDRVVISRISTSQTNLDTAFTPTIRAAQEAVGEARGAWVDTDGFEVGDGVHYTGLGSYRVGKAAAAVL